MPILEVEVMGEIAAPLRHGLAQRLVDAAGQVFESAPQQTWVKLRFSDAQDYAENAGAAPTPLPIFVRVLLRSPLEVEERRRLARALARAFAELCARPVARAHILFEGPGQGRIAFGGEL
jgi:phenylpyruvate tautomerase PptA (4-oxalocrotonate tautomerase family)